MLTFTEFQATKTECPDLGVEFSDASLMGVSGLVYALGCYIEHRPEGGYYLLVGRSDWTSDDLATLERHLYDEHYVYEAPDAEATS